MLAIDIQTALFPGIFRRFANEIGENHWRKRVHLLKQEMKSNVFLREYMLSENEIAFQLNHLSEVAQKFGGIPLAEAENQAIYGAASLAAQVLSIMDASNKKDAERIRRRVHGALRNPADMRGFRLELSAATHFARRGKKVSWPETTGTGTFDLLVEGDGQAPLEVECKSIGEDKGRRIPRRDVIDFAAILKPHLQSTTKGLRKGLSIVITTPDRLPVVYKEKVELAKAVGRVIFTGISCCLDDGTDVRVTEFDTKQIGHAPQLHPEELRETIDKISGTDNRSAILIATAQGGILALTIQSQRDDSFLSSVFDTLSDAAKRQLTGTRAGLLFTGFNGVDGEQLRSIAAQDQDTQSQPTALRVAVSKFLSSDARNHVVGVGFVSSTALRPSQAGVVESGGSAYYFPKPESSFWHQGFSGIFEWSESALLQTGEPTLY